MPYQEIKERRIRRFHRRIRKDPDTGCWEWTGSTNSGGYGQSSYDGQPTTAHRAYWRCVVGPIADDMDLDHLCRNRLCVNPDHLEPVTRSENLERGYEARGCKNGHPFTEENMTVVNRTDGRTFRRCKVCHRERNKRAKVRRRRGLRDQDSTMAGREHTEKSKAAMRRSQRTRDDLRRVEFRGESLTTREWAARVGVSHRAMRWRLRNWTVKKALTTPNRQG